MLHTGSVKRSIAGDETAERTRCDPRAGARLRIVALSALVVLTGSGLRIAFLPSGPQGWDAVDFLLALERYDLGRYQPHFPGYPIYVFTARSLASAASLSPEVSLRVVGAICGALLPLPLVLLLRDESHATPGVSPMPWIVSLAASLAPALALGSVRVESDLPGLFVLLLAFAAASARRPAAAGLLGGLAVGVRLGIAPLVGALALWSILERSPPGRRLFSATRLAAGCVAGTVAWWIPQLAVVGPEFFHEARYFIAGHFTAWGESAWTQPDMVARLEACLRRLCLGLFGGPEPVGFWPLAAVFFVGGIVLYALGRWQRRDRWIAYIALPQAAVVLFLQNPERSRHVYPLVLALAVLAAAGWLRSSRRVRVAGSLAATLLVVQSATLLREASQTSPPDLAAVDRVLRHVDPASEWVFCGETLRLFQFRDPGRRLVVRRARDLQGVTREIDMSLSLPRRVVVFSEVGGQEPGSGLFQLRRNPSLYDVEATEVFLYRVVHEKSSQAVSLHRIARRDLPEPWRAVSREPIDLIPRLPAADPAER